VQVQFWGTRGSIPKPGPTSIHYGGNTLCHEIRTARGTLVIIDCGTGLHGLGLKLLSGGGRSLAGHILISHTHWDHIQGVPFFAPFFAPGNKWDIYGPKGLNQSLRDTLAGQMQHTYFPITPDEFGASIRYHDLLEGTFEIDDIKVTTQYLNHPALTLGYRLEADGATVVYCCDHEPFSRDVAEGRREFFGLDQQHADFIEGADLLIHDAQYTAAEYASKVGWGRTKIRAWVLRESCRWIRAPIPENEPARLNSLRALDLLDTEPEERFDRITRDALLPRYSMCQWLPSLSSTKGDNGSNLAKVPPVERTLVTHRFVPTWFLSGNR
jgi:phosphoribosyl 1,2-cyclic phosphodiesterase